MTVGITQLPLASHVTLGNRLTLSGSPFPDPEMRIMIVSTLWVVVRIKGVNIRSFYNRVWHIIRVMSVWATIIIMWFLNFNERRHSWSP